MSDEFSRRIEWDHEGPEAHEIFKRAVEMGEKNKATTLATVAIYTHMNGEEFFQAIKRDSKVTMQVASMSKNKILVKVALLRAFHDLCMMEGTPPAMLEIHKHICATLLLWDETAKEVE